MTFLHFLQVSNQNLWVGLKYLPTTKQPSIVLLTFFSKKGGMILTLLKTPNVMEVISMESSVYQDLIDRLNRIEQYVERTTHLLQDIDDELEMSTKDLIDTLDVSESTLYRWRKKNIVRFRYIESGDVRYSYKSLLICARCNRLRISGMRNDELLERLLRYKDKLILCNCLSLEQKDEP